MQEQKYDSVDSIKIEDVYDQLWKINEREKVNS
jgi:hypothetical protein